MFEELKTRPKVVATGGLAKVICAHTKFVDEVDDDLTMEGLRILYKRNMPARKRGIKD
jgi:type III pantothenate kinase